MYKLFLLIALTQVFSCCQKAEPEIYLIPLNFTGNIRVVFNQNGKPYKYIDEYGRDTIYTPKLGVPAKYEDGRRVYEIPLNGILLTQFRDNDGFIDRQYFYIDSNGKKTPLEIFKFEHLDKDSAKYIVSNINQVGVFGDGTSGSIGNEHISYQEFTVSDYFHLDSFLLSPEFNNRVRVILEEAY